MPPEKIASLIDHFRCPKCREKVFIVKKGWQEVYGAKEDDPIVFCTNMGHWAGYLSECLIISYPSRIDALEIE